jgi:hypothetical protein
MNMMPVAQFLADAREELLAKLPETAFADIELRLNYSDYSPIRFYTWIEDKSKPENFPQMKSFQDEDEAIDYIIEVANFIHALPSRERQAQLLAGRALGKAIDDAREVGLEVDGIAESFRGVWENLIEDQR